MVLRGAIKASRHSEKGKLPEIILENLQFWQEIDWASFIPFPKQVGILIGILIGQSTVSLSSAQGPYIILVELVDDKTPRVRHPMKVQSRVAWSIKAWDQHLLASVSVNITEVRHPSLMWEDTFGSRIREVVDIFSKTLLIKIFLLTSIEALIEPHIHSLPI